MTTITVGKCYKVIKEDEDLVSQFPELVVDCEFKVLKIEFEGVVEIQVRGGSHINISNSRHAYYWCFWHSDTTDEIIEVADFTVGAGSMPLVNGLYQGGRISDQLESIADELNNYNGSLALHAAEYIRWLEAQLDFSDKPF